MRITRVFIANSNTMAKNRPMLCRKGELVFQTLQLFRKRDKLKFPPFFLKNWSDIDFKNASVASKATMVGHDNDNVMANPAPALCRKGELVLLTSQLFCIHNKITFPFFLF